MLPVIFLSSPQEKCLTFYWRDVPGFYIGYRFMEDQPRLLPSACRGYNEQPHAPVPDSFPAFDRPLLDLPPGDPLFRRWMIAHESDDMAFQSYAGGLSGVWIEEGALGLREMAFQGEENGVLMWVRFTAHQPIPGGCAVQQCLRLTGRMNDPWRVQIAHFPLLSELDMQAMGRPNATLTYARQGGGWFNFPVPHSAYPTPPGLPYLPGVPPLDHGLILRESPHKSASPASYWNRAAAGATWEQISVGMYWERTAFVSNRHPADCLHSWVDLGPLQEGESVTARGKVYLTTGSKDDLLSAWQKDFHSSDL